jgi:hypothetical protein
VHVDDQIIGQVVGLIIAEEGGFPTLVHLCLKCQSLSNGKLLQQGGTHPTPGPFGIISTGVPIHC